MSRPDPSVAVSWTGRPLQPRDPTPGEATRLSAADAALRERPDDIEAMVAAARAREVVWRYGEAVELYTRAMALRPDDYRLPLCRAHRLIRLRSLDAALADLDRAKTGDPTGFNTAYLRGLTLYLMGRWDDATAEYGRCLATPGLDADSARGTPVVGDPRQCGLIATDAASRVAMTSWQARALGRAGRHGEWQALLRSLPEQIAPADLDGSSSPYPDSPIVPDDNAHYWTILRYYRGDLSASQMLDGTDGEQWPTLAYGVAAWHLVEGDALAARPLLEDIVADWHWARLGHVAAEADLLRLGGSPMST